MRCTSVVAGIARPTTTDSYGSRQTHATVRGFAVRTAILVALLLLHGIVILFLLNMRPRAVAIDAAPNRSMELRFVWPPLKDSLPKDIRQEPLDRSRPRVQQQRSKTFAIREPNAARPSEGPAPVDWHAEGRKAAGTFTAEDAPAYRSFGPRETPMALNREGSSFAWDKVHTQRVEGLPEGGILIRLSDNCNMLITLIPMVACSLGKREARGDLFDGMVQPNTPGDWKDDTSDP